MAYELKIPRLGWNMEEGTFVEWLRAEGERVEAGQPLFSIEGDKAVAEIEALESGVLRIVGDGPKKGDMVRVGQVIGYLAVRADEAIRVAGAKGWLDSAPISVGNNLDEMFYPSGDPGDAAQRAPAPPEQDWGTPSLSPSHPVGAKTISPRAARLAAAIGVDWTRVAGTGRSGRVRERDIRAAAQGS